MFAGDEFTRYAVRQLWYAVRWLLVLPSALLAWGLPIAAYFGLANLYVWAINRPELGLALVPIAFFGMAAFIVVSAASAALATALFIQAGVSVAPMWRTNTAVILALLGGAVFLVFLYLTSGFFTASLFWWFTAVGGVIGCAIGANAGLRDFLITVPRPPVEIASTRRWD
jgi:hypothetical protein